MSGLIVVVVPFTVQNVPSYSFGFDISLIATDIFFKFPFSGTAYLEHYPVSCDRRTHWE